jgi:FG-GAP-like repeat/FG-GAP repeat/RTX calcium-binding nonapeptide repeat (4 copies)
MVVPPLPGGFSGGEVKGLRKRRSSQRLTAAAVETLEPRRLLAAVVFAPLVTDPVGNGPESVTVADFNGDGVPDVATANYTDGTVSVMLANLVAGNGDGTFAAPAVYSVGGNPRAVAAGALVSGSMVQDIVTANYNNATVTVLINSGTGTFAPAVTYAVGNAPDAVAIADIGGTADLVVANEADDSVSVLIGNGDGTFQPAVTYAVGTGPNGLAVADLGNGSLDIVATNGGSNNVSVLLGNGNGTFQAAVNYAVGNEPTSLALADFQNTGTLDIAVANSVDNTVGILIGNGDGTFQAETTFAVGNGPTSIAAADIDGDGNIDLVIAYRAYDNVGILLGNGDGTFQAGQTFAVGDTPYSVAVADINNLGSLDVVTTNYADNTISILFQPTAPLILTGPTASPNPVSRTGGHSGTNTVLTMTGDDTDGQLSSSLTYTWTELGGPAGPTFSDNNDDTASTTTVTFTQVGTYTFGVTLTSDGGIGANGTVGVIVNPTLTSIVVSPAMVNVGEGATEQFQLAGLDQFGHVGTFALTPHYSVSGGGTITPVSGLFTAGDVAGGPFTVTVLANTFESQATVTIINPNLTGLFTGTLPAVITPGANESLPYIIENTGLEAATGTVTTKFYLETAPGLGNGDTLLTTVTNTTFSLAAGNTFSGVVNLALPNTTGSFYVVGEVVPGPSIIGSPNSIFSSNEFDLTSEANLTGSFIGTVSTKVPGVTESISYKIDNVGSIPVVAPITTNLYLETAPSLGNGDILLATVVDSTAGLAAGSTMTGILTYTLPDYGGTFYLVGQVTAGPANTAIITNDNTFTTTSFADEYNLALGTLTLAGKNTGPNTITVAFSADNVVLTLNGVTQTNTPVTSVDAIDLDIGADNSTITVGNDLPPVFVRDASLNNFLSLENGTLTITAAPSGNNVIALNPSGTSLVATENTTAGTVSLANVNAIFVDGGGGTDSITIGGTLPAMTLAGGTGSDSVVVKNAAGDVITGGSDTNYLVGGAGADTITGGSGTNTIVSGTSPDSLVGGSGDNFFINGNATGGEIRGGSGLNFASYNPSETMTNMTEVYNAPLGAAAYPVPNVAYASTVAAKVVNTPQGTMLKVFGTAGNDTINVTSGGTDLIVTANGAEVGTFQTSILSGLRVFGGAGDDVLSVDSSVTIHVTLRGGGGDDSLNGGGGDNMLIGAAGNDTLTGGGGINILIPDKRNFNTVTGNDLLVGGSGFNIADFSRRTDDLFLSNDGLADSGDLHVGEAATIDSNIQAIWGGAGDDTVVGTVADEFLAAGSGNASVQGGGAGDSLVGGPGQDTISVAAEPVSLFLNSQAPGEYIGVNNPSEDILQLGAATLG